MAGRQENCDQWQKGTQHEDEALDVYVEDDGDLLVSESCAVGQTFEKADAQLEDGVFHVCLNLGANVGEKTGSAEMMGDKELE